MIKHLSDQTLAELRQLQSEDDPHFLANLLLIFIASISPRLEKINKSIQQKDARAMHEEAHALKSSCLNVGAQEMGRFCFILEKIGSSGSTEGAAEIFEQLSVESKIIEQEIRALPDIISARK